MIALTLMILLASTGAALAQEPPPAPEPPSPPEPIQQKEAKYPPKPEPRAETEDAARPMPPLPAPITEPPHRFWDTKNKSLFAGVFAVRALDFASTLNMRARGRDEILLTNEVVDNKPAFVAIQLGATAASIGLSYWFHRTNHHKLERWVSIVHISVGGFGGVRNYMLETRRPAPAMP